MDLQSLRSKVDPADSMSLGCDIIKTVSLDPVTGFTEKVDFGHMTERNTLYISISVYVNVYV